MADVTIKLNLQEASALKSIVNESATLHRTILSEPGLVAERKALGPDGRKQTEQLMRKLDLLESIERKMA